MAKPPSQLEYPKGKRTECGIFEWWWNYGVEDTETVRVVFCCCCCGVCCPWIPCQQKSTGMDVIKSTRSFAIRAMGMRRTSIHVLPLCITFATKTWVVPNAFDHLARNIWSVTIVFVSIHCTASNRWKSNHESVHVKGNTGNRERARWHRQDV